VVENVVRVVNVEKRLALVGVVTNKQECFII